MTQRNSSRRKSSRRDFVKIAATGLASPVILPAVGKALGTAYPANSKVRHVAFGCQGMGGHDLMQIAKHPEVDIVGLCDIDDQHIERAKATYKSVQFTYNDFRKLIDKEHDNFDSCHVTTPDHMHAPIAMTAVKAGKNCYCQKPLTHEIDEARRLRHAAREAGVVTQMGTQIHSHSNYRTAVALVKSGAIGLVKEIHIWADRAWGNNGRPKNPQEPPPHIHWDLWLGVAPERPFGLKTYHPKNWWSWMDFGTGNLGDMGCHLFDPVVSATALGAPSSVVADCEAPENETWPNAGKVVYTFPGTSLTEGQIQLTWHDGGYGRGYHPPHELAGLPAGEKLPSQGSILVGTRGNLLIPHMSAPPRLLPDDRYKDYRYEKEESLNHWFTFIDAQRGLTKTTAHWDYAGPMTETVLLGNLAKRFPGQELEWDSDAMKVTNFHQANYYTRREYRKGWEIDGLV